jgi:hypothetical protein
MGLLDTTSTNERTIVNSGLRTLFKQKRARQIGSGIAKRIVAM